MIIKPLGFEHQRRGRDQHQIKPCEIFERAGRLQPQPCNDIGVGPQRISHPKSNGKQAGVRQLVNHRPNLTITFQHDLSKYVSQNSQAAHEFNHFNIAAARIYFASGGN